MSFTLQDAIALAEFAHRNQVDKAGLPYIEHPKRVMKSVQQQGALPFVQIAALLHDVIEDTPFTPEMLLALGVPEASVNVVLLLTRTPQVSNEDYYDRIHANPEARMVKLADIDDNTQAWRLAYLPEDTQKRLIKKYEKARRIVQFGTDPL